MLKYLNTTIGLLLCSLTTAWAQDFKVTCPRNYVIATSENLIQARVDNISCNNIQVRTDNGKLKKIGDCTYILIPLRAGECNISISKVVGGTVVDVGTTTFRSVSEKSAGNMATEKGSKKARTVEEVPLVAKPKLTMGGLKGGDIRKMIVQRQKGLNLEETPEVKSGKLKLASYEVLILDGDERIFSKRMKEAAFDEDVLNALKQLKSGHMLLFINVKCEYNNKTIKLDDLIFDLKN